MAVKERRKAGENGRNGKNLLPQVRASKKEGDITIIVIIIIRREKRYQIYEAYHEAS